MGVTLEDQIELDKIKNVTLSSWKPMLRTFNKVIYNTRAKSKAAVQKILEIEVEYLLNNNPDYDFMKMEQQKPAGDGSTTFTITLKRR